MSRLRYAAYGSNLHPDRLRRRLPSAEFLDRRFLSGYMLAFDKRGSDGSGKCTIVPGDRGVHLAVYSVAAAEKPVLDGIEGVGHGYDLVSLELPGFGPCFSYVAAEAFRVPGLAPYCWYREMVLRGCHLHRFPDEYIAAIEAVDVRRDPDGERRRDNWAIVDGMTTSPAHGGT